MQTEAACGTEGSEGFLISDAVSASPKTLCSSLSSKNKDIHHRLQLPCTCWMNFKTWSFYCFCKNPIKHRTPHDFIICWLATIVSLREVPCYCLLFRIIVPAELPDVGQ